MVKLRNMLGIEDVKPRPDYIVPDWALYFMRDSIQQHKAPSNYLSLGARFDNEDMAALILNGTIQVPNLRNGSYASLTARLGKILDVEAKLAYEPIKGWFISPSYIFNHRDFSVYDAETGKFLCDVTEHGQVVRLLRGGRGGWGNTHFKSATRQTPRFAQPGEKGVEKAVILELKLLADVGLVGFPNAGKSTLLSVISAAKPKIANYPFTTLEPNLGIVNYRGQQSFVMADIPGIIEGASEGRGLGLRFLRHIERNAVLLFMIPADSDNIAHEYEVLCHELETFNPDLVDKPRVLAITKCDMLDDELMDQMRAELPQDVEALFISSVAQRGLTELKDLLWRTINDERNRIPEAVTQHDLDERHREKAEDDFIFEAEPDEDFDDNSTGKMVSKDSKEWNDEYWAEDYIDPDADWQVVSDPDDA